MSIAQGSYVWYSKKNAIVKVLKFDSQSNSYTIEYEGRVINTVEKFLDKNVDKYPFVCTNCNGTGIGEVISHPQRIYSNINIVIKQWMEKKVCKKCDGTGIIPAISDVSAFKDYNEGHPERSLGDAFSCEGMVLGDKVPYEIKIDNALNLLGWD